MVILRDQKMQLVVTIKECKEMKSIPENRKNQNKLVISCKKKQQIKYFTSFEAMNEADAKEMASLSPKEHLQHAVFLTKKIFAEELKKPMDKKIKFK